jgi:hypothetical protein
MTAKITHSTSPVPDNAKAPKISFVLAGGGSFGSVQVGMLRALVARGYRASAEEPASEQIVAIVTLDQVRAFAQRCTRDAANLRLVAIDGRTP